MTVFRSSWRWILGTALGLVATLLALAFVGRDRLCDLDRGGTVLASCALPRAQHATLLPTDEDPDTRPLVVSLRGPRVLLDGVVVDDVGPVQRSRAPQVLEGLGQALRSERDRRRDAHPDRAVHTTVVLRLPGPTSAAVYKSLAQTAFFRGWTEQRLLVRSSGAPGSLGVLAGAVPQGLLSTGHPSRHLFVEKLEGRIRITRVDGRRQPSTYTTPEDLAVTVTGTWQQWGEHREPTDRRRDSAIVVVSNDASYSDVVQMVDAVLTPQRVAAGERVPCYWVRVAVEPPDPETPVPRAWLGPGLSLEEQEDALRSRLPKLCDCFQQTESGRQGKLTIYSVTVAVELDGTVSQVEADTVPTLFDQEVATCILLGYEDFTFPRPWSEPDVLSYRQELPGDCQHPPSGHGQP